MKPPARILLLFSFAAAFLTVTPALPAQAARFFRISGPATTTITAMRADGTLVWSNALAGTNYIVQTVTTLPGEPNWVDYVQLPVTNRVNTNLLISFYPPAGMALIPAGSFTMGDTFSEGLPNELPLHSVFVSAFYMDKYDVTHALWQQVYDWAVAHGYSFDNAGSGKGADHPVQTIDWYDCVKWCNARSEMEGRTPAYYTDLQQTAVYRSGTNDLQSDWVKWNAGYRLPTEAEWEKAARGGPSGQRFPWGDTVTHSQANYYSSASYAYDISPTQGYHPAFATGGFPYTGSVGYFAANGYGLHDMAGNVWQWCWDWYGSYASASPTDPRGVPSGFYRMVRGGAYNYDASRCRAAGRGNRLPASSFNFTGFRSVLSAGQ